MLDRDTWTLQGLAEEVRGGTSLAALLEGRPVLVVHRGDPNDEIVFNTPSRAELETQRDLAKTQGLGADDTQVSNAESPMVELAQPHHRVISLIKSDRNPFSGMITVGRARNNDVRIHSANVSKIHCFFHQKDGNWFLEDNSSTNGTLLNNKLVEGKTERELQSGDEIIFGGIATLYLDDAGLRMVLDHVPSA
jgi:FHA domain-containing protein